MTMSNKIQVTAREYVKGLCDRAENHRAVNHLYLQQLAEGRVPNVVEVLKDLTYQYHAYSGDFLRYLTATISLMGSPE